MIDYIVKYQNNYAFQFLFKDNFTDILQLEISVNNLLESDIFCHQFDYDEWP
jgi:hypothetical protein